MTPLSLTSYIPLQMTPLSLTSYIPLPSLAPNTDRAFIEAGSRLTAYKGPVWSKWYVETWPGEDTTASKALSTAVQGTTVGLSTMKSGGSFRWSWGDLRGGTPAMFVGGNRYLTFFHSSNEPPATGTTCLIAGYSGHHLNHHLNHNLAFT